MVTNPQIIQETIEQVVNQHNIDAWDRSSARITWPTARPSSGWATP